MASTILIHLMASMVFTTLFSGATDALIGYDCGRKSAPNITTISLRHVGKCDFNSMTTETEMQYVNLLQKAEFESTMIESCRVIITQNVKYCGMGSHTAETNKENTRNAFLAKLVMKCTNSGNIKSMIKLLQIVQITELLESKAPSMVTRDTKENL
ncbi:uncharacterized protein LOC116417792 isoform X1 [Nasonia vitripennis]|uniref:Uncharacterized protein n=1 Tax=Nasonia vitripennis TaxID=7425 RepID=A0A7M7TB83_NASVI|nr:uncharacterized protein LOC116417792 isoform X1 [Nasonia vitripennis]XP_031788704.1 uncharacterized protein LOC116417792 isoform X1 [Nasonia vitripennis]XP_031788705.1 uncharacterized protein LOC116417792 isoform X1 [Nasonia vitripennis]